MSAELETTKPLASPLFETSAELANLAEALCKAQAEIDVAIKNKENPHLRSKYADLASCWDACREQISRHGLSLIQLPSARPSWARVTTLLLHTSGQWVRSTLDIPVVKQDAQGVGTALAYARRYALCAMLGIAQDDNDGEDTKTKQTKKAATSSNVVEAITDDKAANSVENQQRLNALEHQKNLWLQEKDYIIEFGGKKGHRLSSLIPSDGIYLNKFKKKYESQLSEVANLAIDFHLARLRREYAAQAQADDQALNAAIQAADARLRGAPDGSDDPANYPEPGSFDF